jgi:DNA-binding transcriptional LysR family regulator
LAIGNAPIPLKKLAADTFILYGPPGTGMYDAIIAGCHAAGFDPSVGNLGASTQQAPRIGSTLSLVAAGLGVTFVPISLKRMNIEGVVYRPIESTTPMIARPSLAAWRFIGDCEAVHQRRQTYLQGRDARLMERVAPTEHFRKSAEATPAHRFGRS